MIQVTSITFLPPEKLEDLTRVTIEPPNNEHKDSRVHIEISRSVMHMTIQQFSSMVHVFNAALLPILEAQAAQDAKDGEINIQVGDSMKMKDSLN